MKWFAFLLTTLPLLIQRYAERYELTDYEHYLDALEKQNGVPNIKTFDYIIGERYLLLSFID